MYWLRLSVLLKDTSAATGQAGIQTHILTTPELESNAQDRLATTPHVGMYRYRGAVSGGHGGTSWVIIPTVPPIVTRNCLHWPHCPCIS